MTPIPVTDRLSLAWDEIVACAGELKALGCSRVILTHVITLKFLMGMEGMVEAEARPRLERQAALLDAQGLAVALSSFMVTVNMSLAFFNLLPLPPLDGFQALMSLYSMGRRAVTGKRGYESAKRPPPIAAREEAPARSPAEIHFDIGLDYQKGGELGRR